MRLLRDTPIKHKLTIITMLASGLALLLACLAFVTYELLIFRSSMVSDLSITAATLGDNSAAALTFRDPIAAEQTLRSLSTLPRIVGAAIYDSDGRVFATYRRATLTQAFDPPVIGRDGHEFDGDSLKLFRTIQLAGERSGTIYIQSDLDEMRARLRRYAVIVALVMIVSSFAALLLSIRLRGVISRPISHLAAVVGAVARDRNYAVRAAKQGEDELGRLIDGFNAMLSQIQTQDAALREARDNLERRVEERTQELQKEILERQHAQAELESIHGQLLQASRQAGMAEVATIVLHNVGNVLNSVNVSAGLAAESMQQSKAVGLARVVALLREHEHDLATFISSDPRGKHLPAYLANLSEHLLAEQAATVKELDSLRGNVEHIKEIVTMQQRYATVSGVKEIVNVIDLVEDSVRMNADSLSRHGVEVIREFDKVPRLNLDKHKVLQILVNLIRNAKYACQESARADKRLALRVAKAQDRLRISVIDNGIGIAPEHLTRIFAHGFTTRKDGHGFGLHSGVLAAQEMGGSLRAHSDGVGRGATFMLELPLHALEAAHA